MHLSGTCHRGDVCLVDVQMVHIVLQEEGVVEYSSKENLVIREADDVLRQDVVGRLKTLVHIVPAVVASTVEGIADVQQVGIAKTVS